MRANVVSHQPLTLTPERTFYPADLLPALQSTLRALADIDFSYASARDRLDGEASSPEAKQRRLDELEARHAADREPYVRQLGDLQRRIATILRCP